MRRRSLPAPDEVAAASALRSVICGRAVNPEFVDFFAI